MVKDTYPSNNNLSSLVSCLVLLTGESVGPFCVQCAWARDQLALSPMALLLLSIASRTSLATCQYNSTRAPGKNTSTEDEHIST